VAQLFSLGHIRFMTWLEFLHKLSLMIGLGVDAVILYYVVPAFRRTRNIAFLFIAIACVVSVIGTVSDCTVDYRGLSESDYILFKTLRYFGYCLDFIFWAIGVVLLVRTALAGLQPIKKDDAEVPKVVVSHWKCSKCGEELEGQFTSCWKCGATKET